MKKSHLYIAGAAMIMLAGACAEEQFDVTGEGKLQLRASLNGDMEVVSRATDEELAESAIIWISNEKGLIRQFEGLSSVPADGIDLVTGSYVAEAWVGDSVSASFDQRCFKAYEKFEVTSGNTTQVDLVCKIANVAAAVEYDANIDDVLKDYTMTVGHARGSLVFEGRDERTGYYMSPSTDKNLSYELRGKQIDGSDFTFSGVIENVKPATKYILSVQCNTKTDEVGGAYFTIKILENEITCEDVRYIIAAPSIEGLNFNIANPLVSEPGAVGDRTVYITSAADITNIELESELFTHIAGLDQTLPRLDLLEMNEAGKNAINAAGISFTKENLTAVDKDGKTVPAGSRVKIDFASKFTDALEAGDYQIAFKASDEMARTSTATWRINISSAPVITLAPGKVGAHSAELRGQVTKDGVEAVSFKYRTKGSAEWTAVEATASALTPGTEFSAALKDLKGLTTYEYIAVSGDFESAIVEEFTTDNDQLPEASFENWASYDGAGYPGTAYPSFWDTGNHGSKTLGGRQVTTQSSAYKHSGNYSICLKSQFVGVMTFGKFAAGNVFAGSYLKTDGTDGELGWGQPWTLKPRAVKLYAKYVPGQVVSGKNKGSGDKMPVGSYDQGIVYVALTGGEDVTYNGSGDGVVKVNNNTSWGCVVKTKSGELFDPAGANVVAYGEHVFETATAGDGLVEITINLEDVHGDLDVTRIIFVASASRYGDYFQGGEGSTLYLDDIELIY